MRRPGNYGRRTTTVDERVTGPASSSSTSICSARGGSRAALLRVDAEAILAGLLVDWPAVASHVGWERFPNDPVRVEQENGRSGSLRHARGSPLAPLAATALATVHP